MALSRRSVKPMRHSVALSILAEGQLVDQIALTSVCITVSKMSGSYQPQEAPFSHHHDD